MVMETKPGPSGSNAEKSSQEEEEEATTDEDNETQIHFENVNFKRLCRMDMEETLQYLMYCGIIPKKKKCPVCGQNMKRSQRESWRCSYTYKVNNRKKRCHKEISIRNGTWFSRSVLTINEILELTYLMIFNLPVKIILRETNVSKPTLLDWRFFLHQVLEDWAKMTAKPLGGPGKVLEIYKVRLDKRKCSLGHDIEGQWIFGGFEEESERIFMVPVCDHKSKSLLQAVKDWILPGSMISLNSWNACQCLEEEDYDYLTLNHSVTFVERETGPHTNTFKTMWRHAKEFLPTYSKRKKNFQGYIAHYMFTKHCEKYNLDIFETFLRQTTTLTFEDL